MLQQLSKDKWLLDWHTTQPATRKSTANTRCTKFIAGDTYNLQVIRVVAMRFFLKFRKVLRQKNHYLEPQVFTLIKMYCSWLSLESSNQPRSNREWKALLQVHKPTWKSIGVWIDLLVLSMRVRMKYNGQCIILLRYFVFVFIVQCQSSDSSCFERVPLLAF